MKRKRLFYVPGMLSLVGIPLLFLILNVQDPIQKVALKVFIPTDRKPKKDENVFSRYYVLNDIKKKKITRVYLEDQNWSQEPFSRDQFLNDSRRNFISQQMQQLAFSGDTLRVLQVELGEESDYADFVWLVNVATIYNLKRYAYVDDSFYFLANGPVGRPAFDLTPLSTDAISVVSDQPEPTTFEIFLRPMQWKWDMLRADIVYNSSIAIGFLVLIIIPAIFWFYKNTKRKVSMV